MMSIYLTINHKIKDKIKQKGNIIEIINKVYSKKSKIVD